MGGNVNGRRGKFPDTEHVKSSSLSSDILCLGNESLKARTLEEILVAEYSPNQAGTLCPRTEVTVARVKSHWVKPQLGFTSGHVAVTCVLEQRDEDGKSRKLHF